MKSMIGKENIETLPISIREEVTALGYQVRDDGAILREETDENGKTVWRAFSKLGARKAVLNDLSPAATFIAYNYNTPVDVAAFEKEAKRILKEVEEECGWMYETLHTDGKTKGKINYTVWSDVFVCPDCAGEVVFWEAAVDQEAGKVRDEFPCPCCRALLTKRRMERAWTVNYDSALGETMRQAKQVPVLINYSVGQKRHEKTPDREDQALIEKIDGMEIPYWLPTDRMMEGKEARRNDPIGITHVHHFYTKRNLFMLSALRFKAIQSKFRKNLHFLINSYDMTHSTAMSRIIFKKSWKKPVLTSYQSGTLYIPSLSVEKNIIDGIQKQKFGIIVDSISKVTINQLITTNSTTDNLLPDNIVNYIFLDPPFGSNIMYSELNYISESWQNLKTDIKHEAIENSVQGKGTNEYRQLMTACLKESYRFLKPGHWITVEFSNTKASVWNSIQTALSDAGFIVANVSALDKKQGSFKAVTTPTAVKQDLVISAYKPQ